MKYTAGEIKRAIVANTRPGLQRKGAMAEAKSIANIGRSTPNTSNRKITERVAAKIFKKMEETGDIKSRVADRPVHGMTAKGLAKAAVSVIEEHPTQSASEVAEARLEEKNKIKQAAGLKVNATQGPTSKAEIHVQALNKANMEKDKGPDKSKMNMELALDKSGMDEFGLGLPGEDMSTTSGYKKGVDASVSATERKTPAGEMGLAPSFSIPHHEAPKPQIKLAPTVAPLPHAKALETPAAEPEEAKAATVAAPPTLEPGNKDDALDLPISE